MGTGHANDVAKSTAVSYIFQHKELFSIQIKSIFCAHILKKICLWYLDEYIFLHLIFMRLNASLKILYTGQYS